MIVEFPYSEVFDLKDITFSEITLSDHMLGFDSEYGNLLLDFLNKKAHESGAIVTVKSQLLLDASVTDKYKNLSIRFDSELQQRINFRHFYEYNIHPELDYINFICSFNGTGHVSRQLLPAILKRNGWFDPLFSSKNPVFTGEMLHGHIEQYVPEKSEFYSKFIISQTDEEFYNTKYSFGHDRFRHGRNIYKLENKITQSFLHIVSETMATSYYPFVTEKFLYSVVTRGLFLAYAHPGWHTHLEQYYGFKKYNTLFDYRFDSIQNPIERLIELMSMISKFSKLSPDDWKDLYLLEQDTIEYNYNHYFSRDYLKGLAKYS